MSGLISNSTYVLGDPNTRDLYLGKGLKAGFEGDKYYIAADETVLWEGTSTTMTLSENANNFEYLRIIGHRGCSCIVSIYNNSICPVLSYLIPNDPNPAQTRWVYMTTTDGINWTIENVIGKWYNSTSTSIAGGSGVWNEVEKVVGINRKRD